MVKGKAIKALTKVLSAAKGCTEIKLVHQINDEIIDTLKNIGFSDELEIGDYLIPEPVGKVTSMNANGKEIIRRDLPKSPEPRSFFTTWKDWHGQEHSGIQTRSIDMYPREYIHPQSQALHIIQLNNEKYVSTDALVLNEENEELNIHICNIMLECFGGFDITDAANQNLLSTKIRQLHWDILPPGEYPWARAKPLIGEITKKLTKTDKETVEARMEIITRYNPDFLATGRAGFSGYFVYGFRNKGVYILESIHLDNATYVFGDDWETLSKLTKKQIINGEIQHQRIVHDRAWKISIRQVLAI